MINGDFRLPHHRAMASDPYRLPCFVVGTAYGDLTMTDEEANHGRISENVVRLLNSNYPTGRGSCLCHVGGPSSKTEIYYDPAVRFNINDVIANGSSGRLLGSKLMVEHGKTPEYADRQIGKMTDYWVEGNRLKAEFEIFDATVAKELRSGKYAGFSPGFEFGFCGDRISSDPKSHKETSLTEDPVYSSCRTFDVVASKYATPSLNPVAIRTIERVGDRSVKDERNKFLGTDKSKTPSDSQRDPRGPFTRSTPTGMEINALPPSTQPTTQSAFSNSQLQLQQQQQLPQYPGGFSDPARVVDPRGGTDQTLQQQQKPAVQSEDERIKLMAERKKAKHSQMKQQLAEYKKAEEERRSIQEEEFKRYAESQEPRKAAFLEYYAKLIGKTSAELDPIEVQAISTSMTDPKLAAWGQGLAAVMRENANLQSRLEKSNALVDKLSEKRESLKRKIADEKSVSKVMSSKRAKTDAPPATSFSDLFGTANASNSQSAVSSAKQGPGASPVTTHSPLTTKSAATGISKLAPVDNLFGIPMAPRTISVEASHYSQAHVPRQSHQPTSFPPVDQEDWIQMLRSGSTIALDADPRELAGLGPIARKPDYTKYL